MSVEVTRAQVLAYRAAVHQLDRPVKDVAKLTVLGLGLQDSPPGAARLAVAARLAGPPDSAPFEDEDLFATAWTVRGAPGTHLLADLPALAAGLWPRDDADAKARIGGSVSRVPGPPLAAIRTVALAMADVVTEPMAKGAVSTALTGVLPSELIAWCPGCKADHVSEQLMRLAALPAGVRIRPGTSPLVLAPLPDWPGPAAIEKAATGLAGPVAEYARLHGPATVPDAATYLTASKPAVAAGWDAADLREVSVDGRPAWIPADRLAALRRATPPDYVRLLPSFDPFTQARDRSLLLPDRAMQKQVWRSIGAPGVVFADGELVGVWRPKAAGKRLDLTVEAFGALPPPVRKGIEVEAERVAAVRGASTVEVHIDGD